MKLTKAFKDILTIITESFSLIFKNPKALLTIASICLVAFSIIMFLLNYSMMELTKAFKDILTIITKSLRLIFKNLKPVLTIASICLIAPSILMPLLNYSIQFLPFYPMVNLLLILTVFFLAEMAVSMFTRVATTLAIAASYTGKTISLLKVLPTIKSTLKMQMDASSNISHLTILVTFAVMDPNLNTIPFTFLIGVPGLFYEVYSSVVWVVAQVVSAIEQDFYAKSTLERSNKLVEANQVHHGWINVLLNLLALGGFCGYRFAVGDRTEENVSSFVLFMVNILSLFQMFVMVACTVSYFESKKCLAEESQPVARIDSTVQ